MAQLNHIFVGGLVAVGFDATGKYLLTVSHSGRAVFSTGTWKCVAQDDIPFYPAEGMVLGIGPLDGQLVEVIERNEKQDRIKILSPDGRHRLVEESEGVTVT